MRVFVCYHIATGAGRIGVGCARVVGAHIVGQGVAARVEWCERENREVRFLVEAGFPVVGIMGCQLGLGSICPMSGVDPESDVRS